MYQTSCKDCTNHVIRRRN